MHPSTPSETILSLLTNLHTIAALTKRIKTLFKETISLSQHQSLLLLDYEVELDHRREFIEETRADLRGMLEVLRSADGQEEAEALVRARARGLHIGGAEEDVAQEDEVSNPGGRARREGPTPPLHKLIKPHPSLPDSHQPFLFPLPLPSHKFPSARASPPLLRVRHEPRRFPDPLPRGPQSLLRQPLFHLHPDRGERNPEKGTAQDAGGSGGREGEV